MNFRHQNLEVWQNAKELVKNIYSITENFPSKENFILIPQICRAALSIPLNIAEGSGRWSQKEFAQFVRIAIGSLLEVDTCLKIAMDLKYLKPKDYENIDQLISSLYFKLIKLEKVLRQKPVKELLEHIEQLER
ncbi:MAG: four helix bundle protein [Patescibacteria group bacterium]|nr:four helix bundle protein [Patescibacteria group bacterium]